MSSIYFSPSATMQMNQPSGTIIIGSPGSGKTFFSTNLAANEIACGKRVMVIDPKNDFLNLKNISKDVMIVDINKIDPGSLNPFIFLNSCDSLTLKTIIEIILGGIKNPDASAKISGILEDFVVRFNKEGQYVDMQDVVDYLYRNNDSSIRNLAADLQAVANSKYGSLLFTRARDAKGLDIGETDNVIFSLLGLPFPSSNKEISEYTSEENFTSAIVYILGKKMSEVLATSSKIPTTLFCDEAHILFANQELTNVIHNFLAMGRALNVATVLASQSVKHFPENISQFISNKFMFKSSIDDASQFLEKFDTTNIDPSTQINRQNVIATTANLETGNCFYIDAKSRSGIIHIISNFDVSLFSSNPLARAERGDLDG